MYLQERVGIHCGEVSTVASGYSVYANAPSIIVHEGALYEEHVDGQIGVLIFPERCQGDRPIIIDFLDVFSLQLIKWCIFSLSCEDELWVCLVDPLSLFSRQPPYLQETGF